MKQAEFSKSKTTLMNINKPTEKAEGIVKILLS